MTEPTHAGLLETAERQRTEAAELDGKARALRIAASNNESQAERIKLRENESIPVDRSKRTLTDGSPVSDDHRELRPDGQQKAYVVLSEEERRKGFVRPVRDSYIHKPCGGLTTMGRSLAETYARDPSFYDGTFCVGCKKHFPLDQFVWNGTEEQLGS